MEFWLLPSRARLDAALPEFGRVFARAKALPSTDRGLDAALRNWGMPENTPWAAMLAGATEPEAYTHDWLVADLVSMHAEANTARILGLAAYGLSAEACEALGAAVKPWLRDEGFLMRGCGPGRWLLRCPAGMPSPETVSLDSALGVDLREISPRVPAWQRRNNELQIVLTQQTLNQSRLAQGAPAFNALWVWGFGRLQSPPKLRFRSLASQDPALHALARFTQLEMLELAAQSGSKMLRDFRDASDLTTAWAQGLRPTHAELRLADGSGFLARPYDALRFWR